MEIPTTLSISPSSWPRITHISTGAPPTIPTPRGCPLAAGTAGMTAAASISLPRSGGTPAKNGRAKARSCRCTACWILRFWCAGLPSISARPTRSAPKLYDPNAPTIDRIGLQGDAMTVEVCTTNPKIDEDIQLFAQALSQDDELLGERFRTLARVPGEMGY